MKIDIGWLFTATAILLGMLLEKWSTVFPPVLSLVIVIAYLVYAFYIISTERY